MKRTLVIFLALWALLLGFCNNAMAQTAYDFAEPYQCHKIYYSINNYSLPSVAVVPYYGTDTNIVEDSLYSGCVIIPDSVTHNGITYTVNAIINGAFTGCKNLSSIVIPQTITTIDYIVFGGCKNLTNVYYLAKEAQVLSSCFWASAPFYNDTAIQNVYLGDSVQILPNSLFGNDVENPAFPFTIKSITIPQGVKQIQSASVPTSIQVLNFNAKHCDSIENATFISDSLRRINIGQNVEYLPNWLDTYYPHMDNGIDTIVSYASVPPVANANTFSYHSLQNTLLIVKDTASYRSAAIWNSFVNMQQDAYLSEPDYSFSVPRNASVFDSIDISLCNGSSYTFGDSVITSSGVYTDTLQTVGGCDSIVHLNIGFFDTLRTEINAHICSNANYYFGSRTLTTAGTYFDTLTASGGCDSIVTLHLTVYPAFDSVIYDTICEGDNRYIPSFNADSTGTYHVIFQTQQGCDSAITLNLYVLAAQRDTIKLSIYKGNSYNFYGEKESEEGIYSKVFQAENGCDSIIILDLKVLKLRFPNAVTPNGDGINDNFYIQGLFDDTTQFTDNELWIYSCQGKLLYHIKGIRTEKDFWAPEKGKVPTGTYFYRFEATSKDKTIKQNGTITVLY